MMPVSRLANTWKCLNLFYSYYFREIHFFRKGKGLYVISYSFVMLLSWKIWSGLCSISVLLKVLSVLLTWGFEHFWSLKLWHITPSALNCTHYKAYAKPKLHHYLSSSTLSFPWIAFLNLIKWYEGLSMYRVMWINITLFQTKFLH